MRLPQQQQQLCTASAKAGEGGGGFNLINTITHDLLCLSIEAKQPEQPTEPVGAVGGAGQEKHIMKADCGA